MNKAYTSSYISADQANKIVREQYGISGKPSRLPENLRLISELAIAKKTISLRSAVPMLMQVLLISRKTFLNT